MSSFFALCAMASSSGVLADLPAYLMIVVFLVMTGLMFTRRISALLALPLMALAFALVGMVRVRDFFALLTEAAGPGGAALLTGSALGWAVLAVGCVWASRKGLLPSAAGWVLAAGGLALALLINKTHLAAITHAALWSELFDCFESKAILDEVVHKGALRLHEAYTIAFFGGMLAIYVKEKKLAETIIKYAAELGGDRPLVLAVVMMLATLVLFTTLGGLGAIIMVGTIIMPIMLSLGLSPFVVAGVFLIGICAGGTFNPGSWALYRTSLELEVEVIQRFALVMVLLYVATGVVFIALSTRGKWRRRRWTWAATPAADDPDAPAKRRVPSIALLTPVLPILLVFKLTVFAELFLYLENPRLFTAFSWLLIGGAGAVCLLIGLPARLRAASTGGGGGALPSIGWVIAGAALVGSQAALTLGLGGGFEPLRAQTMVFLERFARFAAFWDAYIGGWSFVPAFLAGLVFCLVTTWDPRGGNVRVLTKSVIEGAESVMPAVLLMCGIGMLLQVVMNPQISGYLQPMVIAVTPSSSVGYVIGFGLAAPLALYRGPLNVWGLGLGIAAVMNATGRLEASLLMAMFMSVGAVQGVCDPTNTHNVWIANFLGEDVLAITRHLLPYIWGLVFVGLIVAVLLFRVAGS